MDAAAAHAEVPAPERLAPEPAGDPEPAAGAARATQLRAAAVGGAATSGNGSVAVATATSEAPDLTEWLGRIATRIGTVTGAFAGLLAFFYVLGGAILWIRFRSAGLPADEAVALVPRDRLLVIGLRVLVLPALLSGLVFLLLAQRHGRREPACPTWRRVPRRASLCWLGATVALGLVVPLTPGALAWPVAAFLLWVGWHRSLVTAYRPTDLRSFPLWRAAGLAVLLSAGVSLARQFDRPVELPSTTFRVGQSPPETGVLVSANGDQVAIGFRDTGRIRIFDRSDLSLLDVGPRLDERAPSASLLSRLFGGQAWAATPLELWCGGERYALFELPKLCRTQPSLHDPSAQVRDGVVTTTLHCPKEATPACSGVLRLRTAGRYKVPSRDQFARVELGTESFLIPAGEELAVRVELSREARVLLGGDPQPVALEASLSLDEAGEAVVRTGRVLACFPRVRFSRDGTRVVGPATCGSANPDDRPPRSMRRRDVPEPRLRTPAERHSSPGGSPRATPTPTPTPTATPAATPTPVPDDGAGSGTKQAPEEPADPGDSIDLAPAAE